MRRPRSRTSRSCLGPITRRSRSVTARPRSPNSATRGYLPEALVNYLALLGWSPGGDEELLPADGARAPLPPRGRRPQRGHLRRGQAGVGQPPLPEARLAGAARGDLVVGYLARTGWRRRRPLARGAGLVESLLPMLTTLGRSPDAGADRAALHLCVRRRRPRLRSDDRARNSRATRRVRRCACARRPISRRLARSNRSRAVPRGRASACGTAPARRAGRCSTRSGSR